MDKLFLPVNFFLMGSGDGARDECGKCHQASVPFRLCLFTKHMLMKRAAGPGRGREMDAESDLLCHQERGEGCVFFSYCSAFEVYR